MRMLCCLLVLCSVPLVAQTRRGSSGPRNNPGGIPNEVAADFAGVLKKIDGSKLMLELHDGNSMEFRATRKTVFSIVGKPGKLKDLVEGDLAEIEGRHAPGAIEAVTVTVKKREK